MNQNSKDPFGTRGGTDDPYDDPFDDDDVEDFDYGWSVSQSRKDPFGI